jgi:hypothetical protein
MGHFFFKQCACEGRRKIRRIWAYFRGKYIGYKIKESFEKEVPPEYRRNL